MSVEFVLLPGLHGTCGLFKPLLKLVPGRSIELPKEGPQDYPTLTRWLSSQRFPKSYILVGESFAGPLVLTQAFLRPKGLKGVVLLGSFARMGLPLARPLSYLVPPIPLATNFFRKINQTRLFSGQASEAMLDFFQKEVSQTRPAIFGERMRQVMRSDVRKLLPDIKMPVLSVRATHDQMVPGRAEEDLLAIPTLRQARIDAPHVIAGMKPNELKIILEKFCRSL